MGESGLHLSSVFVELGFAIIGMAVLARVASRWGFSSIPLYLLAGLAFGKGGFAPLAVSKDFIKIGAEIGVLLLLFMLGLEYSGSQLKENLRRGAVGAVLDIGFNFPPGYITGYLLGWSVLPCVLLGGITYVSSSGIIARVLSELGRLDAPQTPSILAILVLEDLTMAVYLPVVGVLIAGGGAAHMVMSTGIACAAVALVLFIAVQYGTRISALLSHQSDEIILLTTFGAVLLMAGLAQKLQVSSAIAAFLVGIALSGPIAEQSHRLLSPLRDLFAATFFFFFGMEMDPQSLPAVLLPALGLAAATTLSKVLTGYFAVRAPGLSWRTRVQAGLTLIARGEFSIVIAGLAVGVEPRLGPLAAAYVLIMAICGPLAARLIR